MLFRGTRRDETRRNEVGGALQRHAERVVYYTGAGNGFVYGDMCIAYLGTLYDGKLT
jgi:hypothetical protein